MRRKANKKTGDAGERLAADYLRNNGYRILETNYQTSLGEIDLIARQELTLVFTEVKTRRSQEWGDPFTAVTVVKQQKIIQVALHYLQDQEPAYDTLRFDVVSIVWLSGQEPQLQHIPEAFDASVSLYLF